MLDKGGDYTEYFHRLRAWEQDLSGLLIVSHALVQVF